MGTTLTAVLLRDDRLEYAHVGDSRLYLWRDETLEQVTDDHSLVGEMLREGHLTREAAKTHPQRSILSRALGTEPSVEIDSGELELRAGDTVLLCSDGLYSMISEDTMAAVLAAVDDPARIARQLVREAKNEGGHDNITVVVLRFDEAVAPESEVAGAEAATGVLPALDEPATGVLPAVDEPATGVLPASGRRGASRALPAPVDEPAAAAATGRPTMRPARTDAAASAQTAAEPAAPGAPGTVGARVTAVAPRRRRRRLWLVVAVVACSCSPVLWPAPSATRSTSSATTTAW